MRQHLIQGKVMETYPILPLCVASSVLQQRPPSQKVDSMGLRELYQWQVQVLLFGILEVWPNTSYFLKYLTYLNSISTNEECQSVAPVVQPIVPEQVSLQSNGSGARGQHC
jgi:hypothetical protein